MVSKELLDELKDIIKRNANLELTDEEVSLLGNSLVSYLLILQEAYFQNYDEIRKRIKKLDKEKKSSYHSDGHNLITKTKKR